MPALSIFFIPNMHDLILDLKRSRGLISPGMPHAAVLIDTNIVGGTLPDREAFPQRTKKRAGNAVKRVIAS
jgi:hypothetical protein